jgi:hypothetical protein
VFILGFVLATMLWLGLWFFHAKPAQAAALQAHESELHTCLAERELCSQRSKKLESENQEMSTKLEDALAGWGRCIRSRPTAPAEP